MIKIIYINNFFTKIAPGLYGNLLLKKLTGAKAFPIFWKVFLIHLPEMKLSHNLYQVKWISSKVNTTVNKIDQ